MSTQRKSLDSRGRAMGLGAAITAWFLVAALGSGAAALAAPDHNAAAHAGTAVTTAEGDALGMIDFPTSCAAEAQGLLERGLALAHHMNYVRAEPVFRAAAAADPECALAWWGTALTWVHPLWPDTISAAQQAAGAELLARAAAAAHTSPREAAYVAALAGYYEGAQRNERQRLTTLLEGWAAARAEYPEDVEAAAFYALALIANAPAEDKTYARQIEAGRILEEIMARLPHHPGAHHYLIHAYDSPPLAGRALEIARSYDDLAPENTHALHMTSHIFTRLGLWPESIAFNIRAARAAEGRTPAGEISYDHLHALDYLAYAHLQQGDDQAAERVLTALRALEPPFQDHAISAYALAAVPARLALERRDWQRAAEIAPDSPAGISWQQFPHTAALSYFARALGAARSGNAEAARAAIAELTRIEAAARKLDQAYDWGTQVAIQRTAAEAWLAYGAGEVERGLELARQAADMEARTEKHAVTPGAVVPAGELHGDMLLEAGRHAEALVAYQATLARSPNRFNSLWGAGQAAERAGDMDQAADYYWQLAAMCQGATGRLAELGHARRLATAG